VCPPLPACAHSAEAERRVECKFLETSAGADSHAGCQRPSYSRHKTHARKTEMRAYRLPRYLVRRSSPSTRSAQCFACLGGASIGRSAPASSRSSAWATGRAHICACPKTGALPTDRLDEGSSLPRQASPPPCSRTPAEFGTGVLNKDPTPNHAIPLFQTPRYPLPLGFRV
jgi:hypothetical protein